MYNKVRGIIFDGSRVSQACMTGLYAGVKELTFDSWFEFCSWKENEEEQTHTYYTTEKRYRPSNNKEGMLAEL